MAKYKAWGLYTQQTVSKAKDGQNLIVIRSGDTKLTAKKKEIPSLIIALLEMMK